MLDGYLAELLQCASMWCCNTTHTVRCCCCSAANASRIFLHWDINKQWKNPFSMFVTDLSIDVDIERCVVAATTITDYHCCLFLLRAAHQNEKQGTHWICRWGAAACRLCGCFILLTGAKRFSYAHALLTQALVCKSLVTAVKQKRSKDSSLISGEWCTGS